MKRILLGIIVIILSVPMLSFSQVIDWQKEYSGISTDNGVKIIQTPDSGYVYLGQTYSYAIGLFDFYLVKLNKQGDTLWTKTYGGPEYTTPKDIIMTSDNGFLICGNNTNFTNKQSWVFKTESVGSSSWQSNFGDRGGANKIIETPDNGCITVGYSKVNFSNEAYGVITKHSSMGDSLWSIPYSDYLVDLLELNDGNYLATGYSSLTALKDETHFITFDSVGIVLDSQLIITGEWIARTIQINDTLIIGVGAKDGFGALWYLHTDLYLLNSLKIGDTTEYHSAISNTSDGGFITCGFAGTYSPVTDYYSNVRKYNNLLQEEWEIVVDSNFDFLRASSIEQTFDGGYIFGGTSDNQNSLRKMYAMKISLFPTDINQFDIDNLPSKFNMSQNYPNPFNPTTTIEFNLPTKSNVTVIIYNLLGQEVQQLVNQQYSAGNYKVTWDGTSSNGEQSATGMYFYQIVTDNFIETKKMVLLK